MKLRIFVSVTWFDYQISSKIFLNYRFTRPQNCQIPNTVISYAPLLKYFEFAHICDGHVSGKGLIFRGHLVFVCEYRNVKIINSHKRSGLFQVENCFFYYLLLGNYLFLVFAYITFKQRISLNILLVKRQLLVRLPYDIESEW